MPVLPGRWDQRSDATDQFQRGQEDLGLHRPHGVRIECLRRDEPHTLLRVGLEHAKAHGAEAVLHCGDVVAPPTLRVLQTYELPVHVIHGNNTGDLYNMGRLAAEPNSVIRYHGQDAAITLADHNLFLAHYPHYAQALACTGDYDLVCCGHYHKSSIAQVATVKGGTT
jgi:predicted phosphodiesterase